MMDGTGRKNDSRETGKVYEQETEICELEGEECLKLRSLWEEVFFEDSKEFTDYYFKEKAVFNHGFALRGSEGMRSMLYLAPYVMQIRVGEGWTSREINYIIGVATREPYRHRGYMNRLLRTALQHMYVKKQPFTFLMPASPKIYQPYQFAYIYDRQEFEIQNTEDTPTEFMSEEEIPDIMHFASEYLSQHYDVFIRRDEAYYKILRKELQAQNGGICLIKEENEINGYFLYAREEKGEIQEVVWNGRNAQIKQTGKKPVIMARIINVKEMLSLLRTDGEEAAVRLWITDPILEENSGCWECVWKAEQAYIQKREDGLRGKGLAENEAGLTATIDNLASWVFGYRETKECFEITADCDEEQEHRLWDRIAKVKNLSRVFINEIV